MVITGVGIVSPLGERDEFWRRLIAGETATRRLDQTVSAIEQDCWPVDAAGAPALPSASLNGCLQEWSRNDLIPVLDEPVIRHALAAAVEAVADAGLPVTGNGRLQTDSNRTGCVIGTSKGGVRTLHQLKRLQRDQISGVNEPAADAWWPMIAPSGAASVVSSLLGSTGPLLTPVAACATGLASLVRGAELIESGQCDVVIAGSSDASLAPAIVASFRKLGVLSRQLDCPESAVRPFDQQRDGFLVGEGAGVVVLESESHAEQRRAQRYAEWLTGGMVADTFAMTKLSDNPEALSWLISDVLRRSRLNPGDIDYVSLHGTATRMNDVCEMRAIRHVFGAGCRELVGSSIKGAIGHLLGAAGSVEFAAMLLAMRDGIVPPTANLHQPEPDVEMNLVPVTSQKKTVTHALKLSLGFGGHLVAAAVRSCR